MAGDQSASDLSVPDAIGRFAMINLGHQVRFSLNEGAAGQPFISVEDPDRKGARGGVGVLSYMYFDLRPGLDLAHARRLARLMNQEIAALRVG
jgi:hypothetical protein